MIRAIMPDDSCEDSKPRVCGDDPPCQTGLPVGDL